jgi:hypothetical protein
MRRYERKLDAFDFCTPLANDRALVIGDATSVSAWFLVVISSQSRSFFWHRHIPQNFSSLTCSTAFDCAQAMTLLNYFFEKAPNLSYIHPSLFKERISDENNFT